MSGESVLFGVMVRTDRRVGNTKATSVSDKKGTGSDMGLGKFWVVGITSMVGFLLIAYPRAKHGEGQEPNPNLLSDSDLRTVTIRLNRSACFGSCPEYSIV